MILIIIVWILSILKGGLIAFKNTDCIPCLFLRNPTKSSKILVYFHGNAEDLGKTLPFVKMIRAKFQCHILAVEYPGYGVYQGDVNEDAVFRDATRVVEFTQRILRWRTKDLLIMGRSIGSGPACYLASHYNTGALILISPYTSIRGVVKYMFGSFSQYFIKERFKNFEMIKKAKCPTFIMHGEQDKVIPVDHSRTLSKLCSGPT
jgi:pimeloyl-ACP methyl ester carboxylesterase